MEDRHSIGKSTGGWLWLFAIATAVSFPSLITWLYFVALAGTRPAIQQGAYSAGKLLQFALPLVWVFAVRRAPWRWAPLVPRGLAVGLLFGGVVAVAMAALYFFGLRDAQLWAGAASEIRGKVAGMGIATFPRYLALGVFYAICHSGLEEYYWRWFVFKQLRSASSLATATAISSLGFMAHHVILLAVYFGWSSPLTYIFSLGVAVGGAVWAVCYERYRSLLGPWVSHAVVDAAIFAIGYDVVRDLL